MHFNHICSFLQPGQLRLDLCSCSYSIVLDNVSKYCNHFIFLTLTMSKLQVWENSCVWRNWYERPEISETVHVWTQHSPAHYDLCLGTGPMVTIGSTFTQREKGGGQISHNFFILPASKNSWRVLSFWVMNKNDKTLLVGWID